MARPIDAHTWLYLLAYVIISTVAFFWRSITPQLGMSFEMLFQTLFLSAMIISFWYAFSKVKKFQSIIKAKDPLASLFSPFFTLGLGFTLSGIAATLLALAITPSVSDKTREFLNMYLQVSLNFLLGGITLVGASLPLLVLLVGQHKHKAEPSPQSSGESGSSQQSK